MRNGKKVAVFGCKHTTKELLLGLERLGIEVDIVVTIDPQIGRTQQVAGYYDLAEFSVSKGIELVLAPAYNLKTEYCQTLLLPLNIDVALVMGWQRLLPDWLLNSLSCGAFGMHGSNRPLPHGRGRSPMNWSLIQNRDIFFTHLFRYRPGVDDGPIVDVQRFEINDFDSCLTMHHKNTVAMIKLVGKNIDAITEGAVQLKAQNERYVSHYPKRTAEDGLIFWQDATSDIYNLIRAVTRPFPGAFTFNSVAPNQKLTIWSAQPFDRFLEWPDSEFGEILEVFESDSFVVKTGDGTLLVTDYVGQRIGVADIGRILSSNGIARKVWENLPT